MLMYDFILKQNIPFIVITNKADKIAVTKVDSEVERIKEILGISYSTILPFSSERKVYCDRVWKEIERLGTFLKWSKMNIWGHSLKRIPSFQNKFASKYVWINIIQKHKIVYIGNFKEI